MFEMEDQGITTATNVLSLEKLKGFGTGLRKPQDKLFEQGNEKCEFLKKIGCWTSDDSFTDQVKTIPCSIPWCPKTFLTSLEHDNHFSTNHRFTCSECKKNLPSLNLLDLHISENHDSFFSVLSLRKPMFKCLVEDCTKMFSTPQERKDHCIEDHQFSSKFKYFGVDLKHNTDKMDVVKEIKNPKKFKKANTLGSGSRSNRQNNNVFKTFPNQLRDSLPPT